MNNNFDKIYNIKQNWKNYKKGFKQLLSDIKHKDTFYKQIPNLLTISRVLGMIPVNILFLTGNMGLGAVLLCILLSTDFFDGKIARKYGIESKFGADLDAICDKVMSVGLMIPLLISNPILIINLLLELRIAMINVIGKLKGIDAKTVFSGKVKTWFLSLTIGFGYLAKFITLLNPLYILFSLLLIPSQIKTICDYMKYVSCEEKKMKVEDKNNNINIRRELSKDKIIMELEKEKSFLLSIKENHQNNIKVKKRKK